MLLFAVVTPFLYFKNDVILPEYNSCILVLSILIIINTDKNVEVITKH